MQIPNERGLQQITYNYLSNIAFKDSMKMYTKYTARPYSFLVNDATLP